MRKQFAGLLAVAGILAAAAMLVVVGLLVSGCKADLQHGLSEAEANEILVLLADNGVAGSKVADGPGSGWAVQVPAADATRAWQVLHAHGLPRRPVEGFAEAFGEPGLIPSPSEDRVRLLRAAAGELERSIMAMRDVLDARVHLVLPETPRWPGQQVVAEPAQAAVLVIYRPDSAGRSPVDVDAVRRLVSGAVAGLPVERVEVVTEARGRPSQVRDDGLAQLGPFTVSRGSHEVLRITLALAGAMVVGLSAALVLVLLRVRRARSAGS